MRILFSLLFMFFCLMTACHSAPLKVGVIVDPPFVFKNKETFSGIAIDLWKEIAEGLDQPYILVERPYLDRDLPFKDLENGEIDILIGPLSVTLSQYHMVDYTLPFFVDKVVVMAPLDYVQNALLVVRRFLVSAGGVIGLFVVIFLIYIHLLWYFEKPYSKVLPHSYKKAISHIFWAHVVRGHHLEIPKSFAGKLLIICHKGIFYFLLITLNAILISFMTAALVQYANPIQSLADLQQLKVGAIAKSKAFRVGKDLGLKVFPFQSMEEGIKAVNGGQIGAYLEDFSDANTYLKNNQDTNLGISPFELKYDLYVFATSIGNPLLRKINDKMLELRKEGIPEKICKEYFSEGVKNCDL